jgi:hypothetical protein
MGAAPDIEADIELGDLADRLFAGNAVPDHMKRPDRNFGKFLDEKGFLRFRHRGASVGEAKRRDKPPG